MVLSWRFLIFAALAVLVGIWVGGTMGAGAWYLGGPLVFGGVLMALSIFASQWGAHRRERRALRKELARREASDHALQAEERDWITAWNEHGQVPPIASTGYYPSDWEAEQDKARMLALRYVIDADEWIFSPEHGNVRRVVYRLDHQALAAMAGVTAPWSGGSEPPPPPPTLRRPA